MSLVFDSVAAQRKAAGPFMLSLIWLMLPVIAGACLLQDGEVARSAGAGLACAVIATGAWTMIGGTALGRSISGIAIMAQISILVANGGPWQIDWHMAYFAALALLMVYGDWVVIVAGAATVAVHHVMLGYVIPSAVFGADSASLERVAFHAVILLVEAGTLIWVTANLDRMFALSAGALGTANQAAVEARGAYAAAEAARSAEQLARDQADRTGNEARMQERTMVVASIGTAISFLMRGDLTYRIDQALPGEYGTLCREFNDAVARMQETVAVVAATAATLTSGVGEMTASSHDLSKRTEHQAASLEETAATLHEVTATVRKTAEGAKQVCTVVGVAKQNAERSGQVMREAVDAMSGIERSSAQIGPIIGVIDEIAFQTNLLALNAGIEAARAGEAGRGFAVVASEVRALAQRSAEAAKEIKSLITASGHQVAKGVDLVNQTGQALDRIVGQITEIDAVVTDIAALARDQATGLDQINDAVGQMDQVTQQNAAMVEESTAASQALVQDTETLFGLISRFEIGRPATVGRPTRRAA